MQICSGDPLRFDDGDPRSASNFEIISAFSLAPRLSAHCIINTAGNELFVGASSCRNAKIIAVYNGHLEAIACGRCSCREGQELLNRAPPQFREAVESAPDEGEPRVIWRSGYIAEQGKRAAKEWLERRLMQRFQ